ncbi:MAG: ribonuclease D [bacterium]|nr:ribonuclease D [bacterium]
MTALITTPEGLARLAGDLVGVDAAGLDTEFVSERTYRPVLCLVSLAWPGGEAVVDAIALPDLRPLAPALTRPGFALVLHAASQDLVLLEERLGSVPKFVFDTQLAGAFLGHGQISYERLVQAVLGIRLEGASGYSDWTRRPLSEEQLRYAREDARHLPALHRALATDLDRRGRREWFEEECRLLRERSLTESAAGEAWQRVDGARRLKPSQMAVLRELAAWREDEARRADLPVGYVIRDAALTALAQQAPRDLEALGRVRGMAGGQLRRYGKDLLAAIERGLACPREGWPELPEPPREEPGVRLVSDFLASWVRKRAQEEGLTGSLLATRDDVAALVRWHRAGECGALPRVFAGWRRGLVGDELVDLLEGKLALALVEGGLRLVRPGSSGAGRRSRP